MARPAKYPHRPGIYYLEILKTGERYVGSTKHLGKRIGEHFEKLKAQVHHSKYLQEAYNEAGREGIREVIIECHLEYDRNYLNEREAYWITQFRKVINTELDPSFQRTRTAWWVLYHVDRGWLLIQDLATFSRANNLLPSCLTQVSLGNNRTYKGWFCRKATEAEIAQQQVLTQILPEVVGRTNKKDRTDPYGNVLPTGVVFTKNSQTSPYLARFGRTYLGAHATIEEASATYQAYIKDNEHYGRRELNEEEKAERDEAIGKDVGKLNSASSLAKKRYDVYGNVLPRGVQVARNCVDYHYFAVFNGKTIGHYLTIKEASEAYQKHIDQQPPVRRGRAPKTKDTQESTAPPKTSGTSLDKIWLGAEEEVAWQDL